MIGKKLWEQKCSAMMNWKVMPRWLRGVLRVRAAGVLMVFFFWGGQVWAQDIHFSQYYSVPMVLNPGMTAFTPACYRVGLAGRLQWSTVMKAYKTAAVFAEKRFLENKVARGDYLGAGVMLYHDRSGDGPYMINEVLLSVAYHKSLGSSVALRGGLGFSYVNKALGDGLLTFPSQYVEGVGIDPNRPTGELYLQKSVSYPDLHAGLVGAGAPSRDFSWYFGVAGFHLLEPEERFVRNAPYAYRYARRLMVHGGVGVQVSDFVRLLPNFATYWQRGALEVNVGTSVEYSPSTLWLLVGGLQYRVKDAWVFQIGGKLQDFTLGIAVDVNIGRTGQITPATRGWAGIEFVLRYEGRCRTLLQLFETFPCPRI